MWTCSDDLKHTIWVSSSLCLCSLPVLWNELVILAPTFPLSLEVMLVHSHAKDTLQKTQLWVEPGLVPRIMWIMSKKNGRLPFHFSDSIYLLALYFIHPFFWSNCEVNNNNSYNFCWAQTMCQMILCFMFHSHRSLGVGAIIIPTSMMRKIKHSLSFYSHSLLFHVSPSLS